MAIDVMERMCAGRGEGGGFKDLTPEEPSMGKQLTTGKILTKPHLPKRIFI